MHVVANRRLYYEKSLSGCCDQWGYTAIYTTSGRAV
jgi:hypothetical protein